MSRFDDKTRPLADLLPIAGRVPPSDLDAEAAVLSGCLLDSDTIDVVQEILSHTDMYADANKRILEVIFGLKNAGRTVDIVTVAGALRDAGRLDQIGGTPYLANLADAIPALAHIEDHALRVKEKSKIRGVIKECQQIAAEGYGDIGPAEVWIEDAEKRICAATADAKEQAPTFAMYGDAARQTYKVIAEAARSGATMVGYPTGFDELDNHVGGLADGDLWLVGGYPGIGKTSWVKQTIEHVATQRTKDGERVFSLMFSLEMKYRQLVMRSLARRAEIPFANIKIGRMQPEQWKTLVQVAKDCDDIALGLDEVRTLSPHRIRRLIRRHMAAMRAKYGKKAKLGAVAVDYMQLMEADSPTKNRAIDLGTISKGLKQMAGEFKCTFIALSSLNRPDNKQKPKSPGMSALRDSGALEFDADVIMMVHRDDAFKEKGEPLDHLADLTVVKGRNSGTSRHELQFDGRFTAFYPINHRRFEDAQPQQDYREW